MISPPRHPFGLRTRVCLLAICSLTGLVTNAAAAPTENPPQAPEITLGPTGMRGVIRGEKSVTTDARHIFVTRIDSGSPADGKVTVGDVIVGIDGERFDDDARILFGQAITRAERYENRGELRLLVSRREESGANRAEAEPVVLKLAVMGVYSETAPFDCPKSRAILNKGCRAIAESMERDPSRGQIIARSLNALALLASGDPTYRPLLKEQAQILAGYNQSSGVRTWQYAYVNLFLAEYVLATGDRSVVENGLERITRMIVEGQSEVGSWGHQFVDPRTDRLLGYGMMNAPGVPLTISLVLAKRAGVEVDGLDDAIARSERLLRFYVGKGAIPYGDHRPWIQTHDDNGKNGMAAVLFDQLRDAEATEYFSRMSVASHGAERDLGHTGNFFNVLWALPGVARSGPQASGVWMDEFAWHYDLARDWTGRFAYQGPPRDRRHAYDSWDCTGAYLLGYAQGTGTTFLTGRLSSVAPTVDRPTAESLVEDGRGWTNRDRNTFYDSLTIEQLLDRLGSWSPTVRERAAMALSRRKQTITPQLIERLDSPDLYTRYGACQAIKHQRGRAADAVPKLVETLNADDLWLRVLAAEALAGIGGPARSAAPILLERLSRTNLETDPRGMEQRYLAFALFDRRGGLIARSLDGVDRELLFEAVRAGLQNEDGRARGSIGTVYDRLTFDELRPLLPEVHRAIVEPAPSGIMFADGIQNAGLKLFAEYYIDEGIELLADYARTQKAHGSQKRIITIMKMLERYGTHAQRVIPQLEETAKYFDSGEPNFPKRLSRDKARIVRETIKRIEASTVTPPLIKLPQESRSTER